MRIRRRSGYRRRSNRSLLVSGGLVLLLGALGLVAGQRAEDTAIAVHRDDRRELQAITANLAGDYVGLLASEIDAHGGAMVTDKEPWHAVGGDPANRARLERMVAEARTVDVGLVLVNSLGVPLATATRPGESLPASTDPGWLSFRRSVLAKRLPVSDLLDAPADPKFAVGVPTALADGSKGLLIGIWSARSNGLQLYVANMAQTATRNGWTLDSRGLVVAGASPDMIGLPFPEPAVQAALDHSDGRIVDVDVDGEPYIVGSFPARLTGWRSATAQQREDFQGALETTGRTVQAILVALLLIAGSSLVVLSRKRERALAKIALYDDLTGLYNRRGWFALAEEELRRALKAGQQRVLLFVDLDGLKQVNDVLGHREGDRAIADAARVLSTASRSTDLVARLGGDEFVLLLGDGGDLEGARQRLLDALAAHNASSRSAFELRLSLGAEIWFPDSTCTIDELVRRADAQMYEHKRSRPGRSEGVLRVSERVGPAIA